MKKLIILILLCVASFSCVSVQDEPTAEVPTEATEIVETVEPTEATEPTEPTEVTVATEPTETVKKPVYVEPDVWTPPRL